MTAPLSPGFRRRLEELAARRRELEERALDPEWTGDPRRSKTLFRELGRLRKIGDLEERVEELERRLAEARNLCEGGEDPELEDLAAGEVSELEKALPPLVEELEGLLLEDDADLDRDAVLEIRAGTGGVEAALFARDLARMYERYCERRLWKMRPLAVSLSELGGFKEAFFEVRGEEVFRRLRFEMGGHRVQRVPATESQGRIHTSLATVAVLPQAEEVDVRIDEKDLEIQTTTSSGPGGQHVNKTQSAVRITHLPTGLVVYCQEERSQHKNKARALQLLRTRLYDQERRRREEERAEVRRSQVGSGDRNQRIRTYNFRDNRVTDHRIPKNYSLQKVLEGDLDPLFEDLLRLERDLRLKESSFQEG